MARKHTVRSVRRRQRFGHKHSSGRCLGVLMVPLIAGAWGVWALWGRVTSAHQSN